MKFVLKQTTHQTACKKIVIFICDLHRFRFQGQQKIGMTLAKTLSKRGNKIFIITNNPKRKTAKVEVVSNNLKVLVTPGATSYFTYIRNFKTIVQAIKRFDPDILHGHGLPMALFVAFLGKVLKKPTVQTIYDFGQMFSYTSESMKIHTPRLMRFGLFFVNHIICSSNFVKKYLENAKIPPEKITVLHYGIEENWFNLSNSISSKSGSTTATILYWGDAKFDRGIDLLLETIPKIVESFPGVKFIFAIRYWDPVYHERIRKIAWTYPIEILNYPYRQHISEIVSSADIIVLPFYATTIYPPLTLAESLLTGRAVITTNVEANRELIGENARGMLVEPNNPEKLAKAIIDLLSDEEKRKKMSARAHSFIFGTYNWDNVVKRVVDIYERICANT